ncbi:MAG: sterol desaturase family protein [Limisphaerales bacterium]|jgi:sterol desaturase/sphingolipid hydroxylase (fatty acid hydroxylase superfamily)|nr:sterol desaturase family protein [Flavobacteriaceae bacterium]MDC0248865.1 sterol desaturase family protein [Flavobacteriaceae bacterium]|tara:strand:- start:3489 stop:4316 length:828 start_codon:yes stop_codon:yes gene_type:complete
MHELINYFENISSLHRSIILVGGITLFWSIESIIPLFNFNYKKFKHALPNFFFTLTTIIVNFSLAFILLLVSDWVTENNYGLLNYGQFLPLSLYIIFGVLFLDLIGAYLPHYVQHKVKFLWKIHLVHHSDHKVDTTTANRHHPFESVVRYLFTLLGVAILGANMGLVFLYQSLSVVLSQFNHANINISPKIDKFLSFFIVTPNMHKVHHHYVMPYTDSNYGNIFSFWDRLFGTFKSLNPSKIIYGVDTFFNEKENESIKSLLLRPFEESRAPTKK